MKERKLLVNTKNKVYDEIIDRYVFDKTTRKLEAPGRIDKSRHREVIEDLQFIFTRPVRISNISDRFKEKEFVFSNYNLEKLQRGIDTKEHISCILQPGGEFKNTITMKTDYQARKGNPKNLESILAREQFYIWDPKKSEPIDPSEYINYRKIIRGCIKQFYRGESSEFAENAIFNDGTPPETETLINNEWIESELEGGLRVGCESLEDAEAEAWIFAIESELFEKAELAENRDAYIWEAIKKYMDNCYKKGQNKKTIKGTKEDPEYYSTWGYSTLNSDNEEGLQYINSIDAIEQKLINKALGLNQSKKIRIGYNQEYATKVNKEPVIYLHKPKQQIKSQPKHSVEPIVAIMEVMSMTKKEKQIYLNYFHSKKGKSISISGRDKLKVFPYPGQFASGKPLLTRAL